MDKNDIKQLRQSLHMTQEQLAALMGVSPRTVSNWETGAIKIPKAKILHMQALSDSSHTSLADNNAAATTENNMAMKALLKSQEQIDRLIAVIENITGTPFIQNK